MQRSAQLLEGREVLGITVDPALLMRWRGWLMPVQQPYVMPRQQAAALGLRDEPGRVTHELEGSFMLYGVEHLAICWLTQEQANRLPRDVVRAQPGEHHWPTQNITEDVDRVIAYVIDGRRPSRHREISATQWAAIGEVLPGAEALAGTFPAGSGGNCFATVMAAAGHDGVETVWMQREPFEQWLSDATRPLPARNRCDALGVVYVWRRGGLVDHAAVSLGEGLALHKPSDGWMSPTKVLRLPELIASSRVPGRHLTRHRLVRPD